MKTNKIVFLHIGFPKTGSSAIQVFLAKNMKKLEEFNYKYPDFGDRNIERAEVGLITSGNGVKLKNALIKDSENKKTTNSLDLIRKYIVPELENFNIIISCESLSSLNNSQISILYEIFRKFDINVTIISYLRRQDYFLESGWKQWGVKQEKFQEYLVRHPIFDWKAILDQWSKYFGKESIIVRAYEKIQLQGGLIPDFLNLLKLPSKDHFEVPEVYTNPGFNRDILELIYINNDLFENAHDNSFYNFLYDVLDDNFLKKPFEEMSFLSPAQRHDYLERHKEINESIAREYLKRKSGELFFEDYPNASDHWDDYEGLSLENSIRIILHVEYSIYKKLLDVKDMINKNTSISHLNNKEKNNDLLIKLRRIIGNISIIKQVKEYSTKDEIRIIEDSGIFDNNYYYSNYSAIKNSGINPIKHYVCHGWKEGKNPNEHFNTNDYYNQNRRMIDKKNINPLTFYILKNKNLIDSKRKNENI